MPGVLDSHVDFLVRFLPFNVLERVPAPDVLLRHILERVPVLDIMGRPTEALDVALGLLAVDALTKLFALDVVEKLRALYILTRLPALDILGMRLPILDFLAKPPTVDVLALSSVNTLARVPAL